MPGIGHSPADFNTPRESFERFLRRQIGSCCHGARPSCLENGKNLSVFSTNIVSHNHDFDRRILNDLLSHCHETSIDLIVMFQSAESEPWIRWIVDFCDVRVDEEKKGYCILLERQEPILRTVAPSIRESPDVHPKFEMQGMSYCDLIFQAEAPNIGSVISAFMATGPCRQ